MLIVISSVTKINIEAIRQYLEEWFGRYNQSLSDYPNYLSDIPDGIVPSFTGRIEIIREITGFLESGVHYLGWVRYDNKILK